MPPLYRVATTDTFASESTLETVQEIEVTSDSISSCDTYLDSPNLSSAYSTSTDTPSSSQTSFVFPDEPWYPKHASLDRGVAPADDWGYDLHHSESRQSESSSLRLTPKSVKSSKGFGFSRKNSISDLTPALAQFEPFKIKPTPPSRQKASVPLTLNQIDMLRSPQVNRPVNVSRQHVPHQSRLAALAKFGGHKEQVTGAVKLVVRSRGDEDDASNVDNDAESIFTTVTTTSTSSSRSNIVPVYGRGGAGRAAGAKVTTQIYGRESLSTDDVNSAYSAMQSMENIPYNPEMMLRSRAMSNSSGKSGRKAFLGRMCGKIGSGSDDSQADSAGGPSSIRSRNSSSSNPVAHWHLRPAPSASRESLATIHSCPQEAKEEPKVYGRGGFARKHAWKDMEPRVEDTVKHESRAGALIGRMRKSHKSSAPKAIEEKPEPVAAYGRGGAARRKED